MLTLSQYAHVASVILVGAALTCDIAMLVLQHAARRPVPAYAGGRGAGDVDGPVAAPAGPSGGRGRAEPHGLAQFASALTVLALVFLTVSLGARAVATGHGPFASQYEFAVAFGWGVLAGQVYVERRYRIRMLALLVLPIAGALLLYAMTVGSAALPLVPALQNNLLLTVHVAVAILAYGAFSVACAAGVLFLIQPQAGRRGLPRPALLDEVAYRAVVIAFPLLTMTIVLGAVWADIAWGRYWSWDPKETASLMTWLIYGAYLHARVVRGWRGRRASWLLMLGFAAVLFTFFGNLFFGGLHAYSGVTR